jgi:hypothetical protein
VPLAITTAFMTIHSYYYRSRMLIQLNGLAIVYLLPLIAITPTRYFLASRPRRTCRWRPPPSEYHASKASQVIKGVMLSGVKD